jgi:hypothetical protein
MLDPADLDDVRAMLVRRQIQVEQEFAARDTKERECRGRFN